MFSASLPGENSGLSSIDVYHKNIGLCKARFSEIEDRLSSCSYYTEFAINQTAQSEYYALVNRRFAMADEAGVSHNKSDKLRTSSLNKLNNQNYNKAFKLLCDSYSSIGIKN